MRWPHYRITVKRAKVEKAERSKDRLQTNPNLIQTLTLTFTLGLLR